MKPLTVRRIASRYATFASARIALVIGRWFILLYSARHLSTADFAALAAAFSAAEIFRAVSDIGVDSFVYSRLGNSLQRLRPTVGAALQLRIAAALLISILGPAIYFGLFGDIRVLPVFLLIIASTAQATGVALLQKASAFRGLITLVAVTLAASLIVDAGALIAPPSLDVMALLLVTPDIVAALTASLLAAQMSGRFAINLRKRRRDLGQRLKPIAFKLLPNAAVGIFVMAYSRLDVLVVLPMAGINAQSDYSAGFRLVEPFVAFLGIASLALLAELGSSKTAGTYALGNKLLSINGYWLAATLAIASIASAIGAEIAARQLAGFNSSASLLAGIFAAAIPFRVVNSLISAFIQRLGRFDSVMKATILNGTFTFGVAFALVPTLGVSGAAFAALIGEIVNTAYQRSVLVRNLSAAILLRRASTA